MWRDITSCKTKLNYISQKVFSIYKKNELESTFIEIVTSSGKNITVGCIYRQQYMHPSKFNDIYLKDLLENLSQENKTTYTMRNFNIDLFKYDTEKDSADFLDSLYASFLLSYISTPSRVTPHSKILIDNIFSENIEDGSISGNIAAAISDYYAQ